MMNDPATGLDGPCRVADDMQHRHILTECTSNPTEGTQLARTESGNQGASTFLAGVAISGVCTNEFVGCSDPRQTLLRDQIQKSKLEVCIVRKIRQHLDLVLIGFISGPKAKHRNRD